jgi:methylated-DNA-protein-cysteine methyltransferase related protein
MGAICLENHMGKTINFYEQVYAVVRRIPRGKVSSYGRIAAMLGQPQAARAVGYALNALRDKKDDPAYQDIPWQRVVNSQGRISIVSQEHNVNVQAKLLREEGVVVSDELKIDLDVYLWEGLHLIEIDDILSNRGRGA